MLQYPPYCPHIVALKSLYTQLLGTLRNIARVGRSAKDWKQIIDQQILGPFWNSVRFFPHGAIVPFREYASWPLAFWEEALVGIFHTMGCSMLTKRSVDQLMRALHSKKSAWLPIHKQLCIFLDYSLHQIVILDSKLFPAHQAEMGCWKVSLQSMIGMPEDDRGNRTDSLSGLLSGSLPVELLTFPGCSTVQGYVDLPSTLKTRLPAPEAIVASLGLEAT